MENTWLELFVPIFPKVTIGIMSTDPNELLNKALSLPETDRAALAASLFHSLDVEMDDNADELWEVEIKRRLAEIDSGAVELIPWSRVRQELQQIRNEQ